MASASLWPFLAEELFMISKPRQTAACRGLHFSRMEPPRETTFRAPPPAFQFHRIDCLRYYFLSEILHFPVRTFPVKKGSRKIRRFFWIRL